MEAKLVYDIEVFNIGLDYVEDGSFKGFIQRAETMQKQFWGLDDDFKGLGVRQVIFSFREIEEKDRRKAESKILHQIIILHEIPAPGSVISVRTFGLAQLVIASIMDDGNLSVNSLANSSMFQIYRF